MSKNWSEKSCKEIEKDIQEAFNSFRENTTTPQPSDSMVFAIVPEQNAVVGVRVSKEEMEKIYKKEYYSVSIKGIDTKKYNINRKQRRINKKELK